jgi:cytochrome c biogenesis protein
MSEHAKGKVRAIWLWLSSIRVGIVLLILLGIVAAVGTIILQRPLTDPEKMERAYAPDTLRLLDTLGLTDVFHTWWFAALLALLGINIVSASLDRLPLAWHYVMRPYPRPAPHFQMALPVQKSIPVRNMDDALAAAEQVFRDHGLRPRRVGQEGGTSLYAERNRFARLSAYVVHLSLLLLFGGGIIDALAGYRGFVTLEPGRQVKEITLRNGGNKALPFALRCDGAGQENYPDGTPKRWWSKLVVVQDGEDVQAKEIEVNHPLVAKGIRFYQSSYGMTGQVAAVELTATKPADAGFSKNLVVRPGEAVMLDNEHKVRLVTFIPDFVKNGERIETRSDRPNNPAIELALESAGQATENVWIFPYFPDMSNSEHAPYKFAVRDLQMGYYTGLQVSYEPGQWAVWTGSILLALGLMVAFYFIPMRFWAVPVDDSRGRLSLWLGAASTKNREDLEARFQRLVADVEKDLQSEGKRERLGPKIVRMPNSA